jgi:predicted transcriptional regulator
MKIGKLLTAYMAGNNYSIRVMAKEIGIDPTTLHRLLRGLPCRVETLAQIFYWITK